MYSSSPPPGDWNENIPDDETFEDVKKRLQDELQLAVAKLAIHLKTSSFRIRMIGTYPETYISFGRGRHSDENLLDASCGVFDLPNVPAPEHPQHEPALSASADTASAEKENRHPGYTSTKEKYDANS